MLLLRLLVVGPPSESCLPWLRPWLLARLLFLDPCDLYDFEVAARLMIVLLLPNRAGRGGINEIFYC